MIRKLLFVFFAACSMCFYSCDGLEGLFDDSTDDLVDTGDDGQGGDAGEDGNGSRDEIYLVEKIVETDGDGYQISFEYTYEYIDNFRKYMPVREIFIDGDYTCEVVFDYDGNKIYRTFDDESEPGYTYTLDSRNRVISMYDRDEDKTYWVEYEGDYIKSELCEYGENGENSYSMEYAWEYGRMQSSSRREIIRDFDFTDDQIIDGNDLRDNTNEIAYVSTEYSNDTNLDLNMRICDSFDSAVLSDGPGLFGLTGERSENLCFPDYFYAEDGGEVILTVDEQNDLAMPLKITVSASDKEYSRTYEITYTTR